MKILAFDTSTHSCSVAVSNGNLLVQKENTDPKKHAETLLPLIRESLNGAHLSFRQIDGIAFGEGPGPFTSLRIAAATAQAISLSHAVNVYPIDSMAALAMKGRRLSSVTRTSSNFLVATDARRGEVYYAAFKFDASGQLQKMNKTILTTPSKIEIELDGTWIRVGNAWEMYKNSFKKELLSLPILQSHLPEASDLIDIAARQIADDSGKDASKALPVYLREAAQSQSAGGQPDIRPD